MRVMSTRSSGRTSRRLSIGPSDCPPARSFHNKPVIPEQRERPLYVRGTFVIEGNGLHNAASAGVALRSPT